MGFYKSIYKNELFFIQNSHFSTIYTRHIYDLLFTNMSIGDIKSSSSDDEEEGAEYKVKWISKSEWYECSAKTVVGTCSSKLVSSLKLY